MPVISWVADLMGVLINGIYNIGVTNIGLCIILFTIIVNVLMTPLQIRQQKFSKLNAVMNPELQKIQKKYQGKKDQASMTKMQEETSMVYQKYGVSPTGSCLQLFIQMPILLSLYQVIYRIPGYIDGIKNIFTDVVSHITGLSGYTKILEDFLSAEKINTVSLAVENGKASSNSIIDMLYKLSPSQWEKLADVDKFSGFSDVITQTASNLSPMQNFLGLNISDTPLTLITYNFSVGNYLVIAGAILIPFLAWLTQMLNVKLMPTAANGNKRKDDEPNQMESTMKNMNTIMPLFSAVMCFTFPVGIGIYWIAGSLVRSVQQLIINKYMNKMDLDELVKKNMEKANKKREKEGLPPQKITHQAKMNVKNIEEPKKSDPENKQEEVKKSTEYYQNNSNAKPGSIASKANMVAQFNEKNKKKNKK